MSGVVYSTEFGRMCPACAKPVKACECKKNKAVPVGDGFVRLSLETKGRKGQGVTLVKGVPLLGDELKEFAKFLKVRCGSGGTLKEGVIEIQGDHRDIVRQELVKKCWKLKG